MELWNTLYIPEVDLTIEVSNFGKVRTLDRYLTQKSITGKSYSRILYGKELTPTSNGKAGYYQVPLWKDSKCKRFYVHRLVWFAFNGEIPEGYEIDHDDQDKSNNNLSNLKLITRKDNMIKMFEENPHVKKLFYGK